VRPIDFGALKRAVPMHEVLRLLGWHAIEQHGEEYRGPCPLHGASGPRSRSFAVCGDGFCCHTCKQRGDQLRLYATARRLPLGVACRELAEAVGVPLPTLPGRREQRRAGNGEEERSGGPGGSPPHR